MKADALENYHVRMRRVLDYIDRHLDEDLDLEAVSGVAALSKFHFHRQFAATFELSVHRYIQLARMKRASNRLASDDAGSVTDIAMDSGYDAPDAFARAFRRRLGQSPSSFRKSPDWVPWLAAFGPLDNARGQGLGFCSAVCTGCVHASGGFTPTSVIWEDGREFVIDQVMDIRMAASQKAGAIGIRYTCRIRGKQTYLFLEEDRWFMERK